MLIHVDYAHVRARVYGIAQLHHNWNHWQKGCKHSSPGQQALQNNCSCGHWGMVAWTFRQAVSNTHQICLCFTVSFCQTIKQVFSCIPCSNLEVEKGLAMYGVQCWNPLSKGVTWRDWLLLSMDSIWKSTLIHQNVVLFCQKMFQINPGKNKCFFLTKFKFDQIRFLGYSLNIFFFYWNVLDYSLSVHIQILAWKFLFKMVSFAHWWGNGFAMFFFLVHWHVWIPI